MPAVRLSEHPVVTGSYGRWQPLNEVLGVSGFGVNAVVADPDEGVDMTHEESETGQQELYVVVTGRARFVIGGETVDAPAGTVVAAPDPAAERSFTAVEPGTRIVCIGAPGGANGQAYGEWIEPA
jgi:mannose-6-phosphate isomerase-like protein (cupin superfamily)